MQNSQFNQHYMDPTGRTVELGNRAETSFEKSLKAKNMPYRKAERWEQREHWDYLLNGNIRVDTKAAKRIHRWDDDVNYDRIILEIHGFENYNPGWINGGHADHIAFERQSEWWFIRRKELAAWMTAELEKRGNPPTIKAPYGERQNWQPYTRSGSDAFIYVDASDIESGLRVVRMQKN